MLPDSQDRAEKQLALLKKQIAQRREAEEALRRESAIVKLLQEIAVAANEARTTETAFQFALDEICEFTGWPLGRLFRVEPDSGDLILTAIQYCNDEQRYRPFVKREADSLSTANAEWLGEVAATGEPQWIADAVHHPDFIPGHSLEETGVKAGFAFPVLIGAEVVAVLEFFSLHEAEPDEELLEVMVHIGVQLGQVVERVRAEESLRKSEQRLRQSEALLVEAERIAHLGSWQWDIEEDRVTWSEELYRIFGLKSDEYDPSFEGFLARVHPDDRHDAKEVIEAASAAAKPFDLFHQIVRPDGEVRVLHSRGQPVFDEAGELIQMVGTGQDVTDLRLAEEQLEKTGRQLAALNQLGRTITASLELEKIFQQVLTTLGSLLQAEGIFILLLEDDDFVFAAANEIGTGSLEGQRVPATSGVASEVIGTGRPAHVYGEEARRRAYRHIVEATGFSPSALLAAPLRLRGQWIGVIEAVHSEEDAFGPDDLRLLEAAAAWTAIAIGNARLFQDQQRARRTAEAMHRANQDLTASLDLDSVLVTLLEYLQQLVGYDRAYVMLVGRDSQLSVRAVRGGDADHVLRRTVDTRSYPFLQNLLSADESLSVADVREDKDWQDLPGFPEQTGSCLGVPLRIGKHIVGICLLERTAPGHFSSRHRLLAESLAAQAATALQNARLFTEVRSSRERLRHLTGKVVSAQEEERRRVSRELHDEAGQSLIALKMSLEMVETNLPQTLEQPREALAEAVELTDKTMERIRLLAHDLRPPVLDTFSLNEALEGFCQEFSERSQLSVHYRGMETPSVRDPLAISFYRFLQEALTNVVKHADASQAQVVLDVGEETVELAVEDDGKGFVPAEEGPAGRGIGLTGVRERFEILGGRLELESEPGEGTRVTACAPLEPY